MFCKMQVSDLDPSSKKIESLRKLRLQIRIRNTAKSVKKILPCTVCHTYVFKRIVTGIFWERKNELALFKLFYSKSKSRSSVEGPEPTENGSAPQPWFLKLVSLREII